MAKKYINNFILCLVIILFLTYIFSNIGKIKNTFNFYKATKENVNITEVCLKVNQKEILKQKCPESPVKDLLNNEIYFFDYNIADISKSSQFIIDINKQTLTKYKLYQFTDFTVILADNNKSYVFINNNYNEILKKVIMTLKEYPIWLSNKEEKLLFEDNVEYALKKDNYEGLKKILETKIEKGKAYKLVLNSESSNNFTSSIITTNHCRYT